MTAPFSKKSLRETALLRRLQIPADERARAMHALTQNLLAAATTVKKQDAVVAGYWAVKGEADVQPLLLELIRRGMRAALPQVMEHQKPLVFRAWHETARMIEGRYGIQEPDPAECESVVPDVVLVPLLAFDARGHRLGYGSGFYDRTFDALRDMGHAFLAIGVAFEMQKLDEVPTGPYDYAMDMIVTEKKTYRHERRGA